MKSLDFSNIVGEPQADTINVSFQPTSLFSSDDFYIEAIKEMKYRLEGHKFDRSYIDVAIARSMIVKYGYSKSDIKNTLLRLCEKAQDREDKERFVNSMVKSSNKSQIPLLEFNFLT